MRWLLIVLAGIALLSVLLNAACYVLRARAWREIPECEREDRLGLLHALAAFGAECVATMILLASLPFGWLGAVPPTPPGTRGRLVLVHGWGVSSLSWWLVRRRLSRAGWGPIECFGYSSLRADVAAAARSLAAFIDGKANVTLIGHGIGGLVMRVYARRYAAPQVRRLVTLGTPHTGTWLARLPGPWRRLAPGSAFLRSLAAGDRLPQQFDVIAITSLFDARVLPPANARYQSFNIQLRDVGHNWFLFSRRVDRLLQENLAAPYRVAPKGQDPQIVSVQIEILGVERDPSGS